MDKIRSVKICRFLLLLSWCLLVCSVKRTFAGDGHFLPRIPEHARVVVVHDAHAVAAFNPQADRIEPMVVRGLVNLTGKSTAAEAWLSLISTQDIVGLKVFSSAGALAGTRPAVVAAVIQTLLSSGLPGNQIIVWDKYRSDLRLPDVVDLAKRYGVQLAGSADHGYDEDISYSNPILGKLAWGDHEFGRKGEGVARRSFVSKLVTQKMTKIVNVTPLLNHNLAGVSGNLYGLALGSVDNALRFETSTERLATAIPEIYALPELGDRVVLNIVDALICQYQGEERTYSHYSSVLGQLRFSKDPVALDVLSIQELNRQRQRAQIPGVTTNLMIYTNASLLEIGISDPRKIDILTVP
ncbi:MAG: DUF362 domain-containing protein [Verrucomicrobia bacterium]|nr:DUF362 domain-containing protein [Verrucomicrobiota bacterium]